MYTRSIIIGLLLRHYQRLAITAKNDNSAWEIVYAHAHKQTHKQTHTQTNKQTKERLIVVNDWARLCHNVKVKQTNFVSLLDLY